MEGRPKRETTLGSLPSGSPEKRSQIKPYVDWFWHHLPLLESEQSSNSGQLFFPTHAIGLEEERTQRKLINWRPHTTPGKTSKCRGWDDLGCEIYTQRTEHQNIACRKRVWVFGLWGISTFGDCYPCLVCRVLYWWVGGVSEVVQTSLVLLFSIDFLPCLRQVTKPPRVLWELMK